MRKILATAFVAAFATSMMPFTADAAKSKMGCVMGKEKWDAGNGKCVAAKPVKKAAAKPAPAKAAPAKPAAAKKA